MSEYNVLAFGAGVQSTTLALLSQNQAHGLPLFDFGVFADTGAEPEIVYDCLERIQDTVSFKIHVYQKDKGLLNNLIESARHGTRSSSIPAFVHGKDNEVGMLMRACTTDFKLNAIKQCIRKVLGYKPRQKVKDKVNMFIGISRDEMQRMNNPLTNWMTNNYPLVDMNWRRNHCMDYLKNNWPHEVGKSACTFCPYHDNHTWRQMKRNDKKAWEQACMVDEQIRTGLRGTKAPLYLHRSMQPLKNINWDDLLANHDNQKQFGFLDECDGICGL